MITKRIEQEIRILEKADVEQAVSGLAGREVGLDEMEVTLLVCMPMDSVDEGDFSDCALLLEVSVDGEEILDEDDCPPLYEFFRDCAFYRADDEIFAFDTDEFGSYCREVDSSD